MCGIAGIISNGIHSKVLEKMSGALAHRGPDGEGSWINPSSTAGFAHRRLAIIDPSPANAQPMHYRDRYTIVYNGEIYNYIELRNELRKSGYEFHTGGDTEVILAAYDCYKQRCLHFLDGMFAFAIWDENTKTLFAARDRFGEKPFYFWEEHPHFVFASEMKALWAAGIPRITDHRMMLNYLALGHVQNPADKSQTFFENISSLPPAHCLVYDSSTGHTEIKAYWTIDKQSTRDMTDAEALKMADHLLGMSVEQRLRSDVPTGGSLSGGIDSATIAWHVLRQKKNYRTFSAVFPGMPADESAEISDLLQFMPHENHLVTPTAEELIQDFEKLAWHQEEPFPSSSIYAQYRVHRLAAFHGVKVLLDGQGADEIFAGYHRYAHWYLQDLIGHKKWMQASHEFGLLSTHDVRFRWNVNNVLASFLPSHASIALEKKEYRRILRHPELTNEYIEHLKGREWEGISKPYVTKLNDILHFNTMQMGLEEMLRFADRNAMANGIEVRLPYLQPDLVEFVFSLPASFKIRDGFMKWGLRKIMEGRLPYNTVWQTRKTGFEPPQKIWMEHSLTRDYIHESMKTLVDEKILKPGVLQRSLHPKGAHEADNYDWRYLSAAAVLKKQSLTV